MTKKPESRFSNEFVKATKDRVFWTRIESWAVPGVPDLHGVCEGHSFWVELKVVDKLNTTQIGLRPHQIQWQARYSAAGGRVYNLVHRPSGRKLELFRGMTMDLELGSPVYAIPKSDDGFGMVLEWILDDCRNTLA